MEFYGLICNEMQINPANFLHVGNDWHSDYVVPGKVDLTSILLDGKGEKRAKT